MTTKALLPLLITTLLAVLLVVGLNADGHSASADDFVFQKCPTPTPGTPTPTNTPGGPTKTSTVTSTPCSVKLTSTPTVTPTLPPDSAMSLRVDAAQTQDCPGGPQQGKVCVTLGQKFDVIVVADEIPLVGYFRAQAWIDYDSQGLVHKKNTQVLWVDCDVAGFLRTQDIPNNGAAAGCQTALLPPGPASFRKGDLFSFSLTCTSTQSSSQINLLPYGDPVAGTSGAVFIEPDGTPHIPSFTGILVNCVSSPTPTPTKQPDPGDTDGDGCSDERENGPDETLGGRRDYKNPWDFYDVVGGGGGPPDQIIDLPNDILGVIQRFAPAGAAPYDVQFDRGVSSGPNTWNMTAPDGVIDLPNDILGVILQFNHSCQ